MGTDEEKALREKRQKAADKAIGERLRMARESAQLTLASAGEVIGYGKAQMGHIENGDRYARASDLGELAKRYNQSCDWLILGVRASGISPDGERLLRMFAELDDADQKLVIETAEDRLERARRAKPRKSDAA